MKKSVKRWLVILATVLVIYNVIAFAAPFHRNTVFFLSWVFGIIAIGVQAYVVYTAFYHGEEVKSKFYGFPIAKIGGLYLAAQMVLGLAFMALGSEYVVPTWVPLVTYVVLLGISVIGFVAADTARDEVERQDVKLQKNTNRMYGLQAKAAALPGLTQDANLKQMLEKFSDDLRYSDPVSSEALKDIETELMAHVEKLEEAAQKGGRELMLSLVQKAAQTLAERNRLCKLGKRIT